MRKAWTRPPPNEEEWHIVEPTIASLYQQLREVETTPHNGPTVSSTWPIFRLHHQRSRYLFDLVYNQKQISKDTLTWCIEQGIADGELIAKWKRKGYEGLCCLRCIQTGDSTHGTVCICRVPRKQLSLSDTRTIIECQLCGCRGCGG
jgi:bud site selection protein 31